MFTLGGAGLSATALLLSLPLLLLLLPPQLKPVESRMISDKESSLDDNMIGFMSFTLSMFDDITDASLSEHIKNYTLLAKNMLKCYEIQNLR